MRYSLLIILVLLLACHEQNKNKISPAELVKSREIKKVSEAEILTGGTELARELQGKIDSIVERRIQEAKFDCETTNWIVLDSLFKNTNAQVGLIHFGSQDIQPLEYQLLEAYQYNLDNDLVLEPSVQKLNDRTVLYTWPMVRANTWFDSCTNGTGKRKAKMWSLKIPVKEVIQQL